MNDDNNAAPPLPTLPPTYELLCDRGWDGNWFRAARAWRGTTACIQPAGSRKVPPDYDSLLY